MENPFLELFLGQITLESHFYMISGPFNAEESHFLPFFQYFHLFFIGKELWYEVMKSINIQFFLVVLYIILSKNYKNPSLGIDSVILVQPW